MLASVVSCSCPAGARDAVVVTLRDARSRQPVCNARVFAEEGAFRSQLVAVGCSYSGPRERAGTYAVVVEHSEYRRKVVSGIEVDEGECGSVETKQIEILIESL